MELAKTIRLKIGSSILRKKVERTSRKIRYTDIGSVKKIGIIWDASNAHDFMCLSKFYQRMNERNIEVKILGYYPGKNLPDQYTAIRYLTCLRREELNFFYLPVSNDAESFIKEKFDILIDINFDKQLPARYITSLSSAALKVGLSEPDGGSTFDLMIEMKKPVKVDEYLDQTLHYLEMIHAEAEIH